MTLQLMEIYTLSDKTLLKVEERRESTGDSIHIVKTEDEMFFLEVYKLI